MGGVKVRMGWDGEGFGQTNRQTMFLPLLPRHGKRAVVVVVRLEVVLAALVRNVVVSCNARPVDARRARLFRAGIAGVLDAVVVAGGFPPGMTGRTCLVWVSFMLDIGIGAFST